MSSPPETKVLASAFDSPTFGEDSSFHVEQPVGSMSISPCGRDVVLASKEGLHVIDLDNPYTPPRYLPHRTPWEVADVQWSPFAARDWWVVSTSNQKALVWNLAMKTWQNSIEHVLHAHSRAITDINFSAHHPDILATCAVDSFVHCWDLRAPARPVLSFSDWIAGATQVKYNRQDPHVISSSHDRFLRIWDDRKGAYPLRTIEAHNTKIYGVDWNRTRAEAIVTCSLDRTVKFWDYSKEDNAPEKVIHAPFPVWRARNTPFGYGLLAMPQRGNSDLHLYSRAINVNADGPTEPPLIHSFPGHNGQVKEFLWRARGNVQDGVDNREFQLVSWGTDKELRLHRAEPEVLGGVGYEKGKSFDPSLNITRKGAIYKTFHDEPSNNEQQNEQDGDMTHERLPELITRMNGISMPYARRWTRAGFTGQTIGRRGIQKSLGADMNPISWMRGVKISGWDVETLGDEISHVGEKFSKVAFESVNVGQRKATLSLHGPWGPNNAHIFLKIDIKFPSEYPRAAVPVFNVQKTTSITSQLAKTITSKLHTISEAYLSRRRGCLEGILRFLLGEHSVDESVAFAQKGADDVLKDPDVYGEESSDEDEEVGQFQDDDLGMSSSELLRPINANVMVPIARACGALWTNDGRLVCFFPPKKDKSYMGSMGLNEMSRLSRNYKVFEAFGRLQAGSPGPKQSADTGTGGLTMTDDDGSDYSDDSSILSSSSSGSSGLLDAFRPQYQGPQTWRSSTIGHYRSRSPDNSQRSTVGVGTVKSSTEGPHNTIYIYEFKDLLPVKRDLAEKYIALGDRTDICSHNMAVAANSENYDVADVWGLVKLMLKNQLPTIPIQEDDIITFARRASNDKVKDVGSALLRDTTSRQKSSTQAHCRNIRWGENPLGGRWLIPALFAYFERLGDLQTLALLSCVLYEPARKDSKTRVKSTRAVDQADPSSIQNRSLSVSSSFPASRLQVQPQHAARHLTATKDANLISGSHSSACSSAEQWPGDTPLLGTTPPTAVRSDRLSMEHRPQQQAISLAGSPDQRSEPRSASNVGTTMASSLSRSFTFGPSGASSPPSDTNRKKLSPAGSLNTSGLAGYPAGGFFGKPASAVPDYLTASTAATSQTHSDTESERQGSPEPNKNTEPTKGIKITLKNRDMFDSDSQTYVPLLDEKLRSLAAAYRHSYANFLLTWRMHIQRAEILGIEAIAHNESGAQHLKANERLPLPADQERQMRGFHLQSHGLGNNRDGLDIQFHCANCGTVLRSSFVKQDSGRTSQKDKTAMRCVQCSPTQPIGVNISCSICSEMVHGLFTPCLSCGHVTCLECHMQWFTPLPHARKSIHDLSQKPNADNNDEVSCCPTGCGCSCAEHSIVEMSMPPSPPPPVADESPTSPSQVPTKPQAKPRKTKPLDGLRTNKWLGRRRRDPSVGNEDDNGDDDTVKADHQGDTLARGPGTWLTGEQSQHDRQRRRSDFKNQSRGDGPAPSAARGTWGYLLERVETM